MALTLATITATEPEIFASLQGEGPSAGMPVAFVRLSRCNLACVWCDTPYTWHFGGDDRPHESARTWDRLFNQLTLQVEDVAARITALGQERLVITGGEPLLQGAGLADLLALLPDMAVEVETNGTVEPHERLDPLIAQYNVSPKLAHSGNAAALALRPAMLARWASDPRAAFKFVLRTIGDLAQVRDLADTYAIAPDRIFLMPEGTDSETLRERLGWMTPLCLKYGFRVSDRLHIHLYGDTRGT